MNGDQWAAGLMCCKACKRDTVRHHAKGLCRTCYAAKQKQARNGWPLWLEGCLACRCGTSQPYRSTGLCRRCHRSAQRHDVLAFWRLVYIAKKETKRNGDRSVLLNIIRAVGLTATAEIMDKDKNTVREYAVGIRTIDKETAIKIMDAFLKVEP